ncbi:hypothetical protein PR048_008943 [Dryococelus australis]|uniref:Uncharacterized protein n=1 Tax=Dryococelus australis TaxID=614101 RepID=A0ABQ9HYK3_9NEOP|nr:hypothetical protein PR048_008943 [Dryococelus australis]
MPNERVGEKGDLREKPPANDIVRHDSHMRKSGVTQPGIERRSPWWEASRLTAQPPWPFRNSKVSSPKLMQTLTPPSSQITPTDYHGAAGLPTSVCVSPCPTECTSAACILSIMQAFAHIGEEISAKDMSRKHFISAAGYPAPEKLSGGRKDVCKRERKRMSRGDRACTLAAAVVVAFRTSQILAAVMGSYPSRTSVELCILLPYQPSSIPRGVAPGFSHLGIVLDDAADHRTAGKTHRPGASSGTIPTCENPRAIRRVLNPVSLGGFIVRVNVVVAGGSSFNRPSAIWSRSRRSKPLVVSLCVDFSSSGARSYRLADFLEPVMDAARQFAPSAGMKRRGKPEITEKTRLPAASSGTIPTCENPGAIRRVLNPVRLRWEAGNLPTTPLRPHGLRISTYKAPCSEMPPYPQNGDYSVQGMHVYQYCKHVYYTRREYSSCSELVPPHSMHALQRCSMLRNTSLKMVGVFLMVSIAARNLVSMCLGATLAEWDSRERRFSPRIVPVDSITASADMCSVASVSTMQEEGNSVCGAARRALRREMACLRGRLPATDPGLALNGATRGARDKSNRGGRESKHGEENLYLAEGDSEGWNMPRPLHCRLQETSTAPQLPLPCTTRLRTLLRTHYIFLSRRDLAENTRFSRRKMWGRWLLLCPFCTHSIEDEFFREKYVDAQARGTSEPEPAGRHIVTSPVRHLEKHILLPYPTIPLSHPTMLNTGIMFRNVCDARPLCKVSVYKTYLQKKFWRFPPSCERHRAIVLLASTTRRRGSKPRTQWETTLQKH